MKIGFIGAGNMATAIVEGIVQKGFSKPEDIYLYDIDSEKVQAFAGKIGTHALKDPQTVIQTVDTLILAVKPNVIKGVLLDAKEAIIANDPLIVSIAAGTSTEALYTVFETDQPIRIVRVMPNMNAMVGEGAAAVCGNSAATEEDVNQIIDLFNAVGKAWPL
ncbi:MAG: NAD(P)-binding domain-containing protein, partial [Enterococcus sp.]